MKVSQKIGKVLLWAILIFVAVIQIFPLIWLLDFSLASSTEMFTNGLLINTVGKLCNSICRRTFPALLKKQYCDQHSCSIAGNHHFHYGCICDPQNALETERICKNTFTARYDDPDPCDTASEL